LKKLLFLFLALSFYNCKAQSTDQKEILRQEIAKKRSQYSYSTSTIVDDSLVVAKKVLGYEKNIEDMIFWLVNVQMLTENEAKEIFGNNSKDFLLPNVIENAGWTNNSFPNNKIKFYKEDSDNKKSYQNFILHPIRFSFPLVRKDRKYALLEIESENDGGVLCIYKLVGKKWELFKQIPLHS
jgi:hypothetical protein